MIDWRGYICPQYMCILLYVKLIWCSGIPQMYGQLEEGGLGRCAFCYMLNLCGVVVFYTSMVAWRRVPEVYVYSYVKLMWYSGFHRSMIYVHSAICETYLVQWIFHTSMVDWRGYICPGICAFCYMLNLFGVVVFHRCMVNWRRGALVYVHSAICETYLVVSRGIPCVHSMVDWRGIHLPSQYMCILLYVKLIWCSGIPQIYGQLEEGGLGICAFCYM